MTLKDKMNAAAIDEKKLFEIIKDTENAESAIQACKQNGIDLTVDELREFADSGAELIGKDEKAQAALNDEELNSVVGGAYNQMVYSKNESDVKFIYNIGDMVEVAVNAAFGFATQSARVTDREVHWDCGAFYDAYYCQMTEEHWYCQSGWRARYKLEARG